MKIVVYLKKSNRKGKKYMVWVEGRTIHFGAAGMSDYTKHKDKERRGRYDSRHKRNENWGKSGIKTAGFWSKWLLWNKPSISGSKRDISKRFGVTFRSGWPSDKQKKELKATMRFTNPKKVYASQNKGKIKHVSFGRTKKMYKSEFNPQTGRWYWRFGAMQKLPESYPKKVVKIF